MTIPKAIIVDVITGDTTERDFTVEELAEQEASRNQAVTEQEAKETARASALAKLAALGLTEEEIAAL
jgi:DNA-binding NarL/FixJ family response regulator